MSTRASWTRWSTRDSSCSAGRIEAPSEQAVRERLAQDNWHQNGMLTIKSVEPWKVLLDGTNRG